ncbi:carboxymuconolactone decarboxylase family protein [Sphingosinicella soli]|uniref:Alkylhydroperoxidase family enzyme n=1 Tax=Sphingosinicella soli TaxID=333708 RepID=A0A7W7F6C8_9SPHN|nr:carboxymuconolactone decarboxylase family protein [Sphingosinicella soli]MBB4632390.1 alkylhydroperoxidase family enzyme [Sphingosinicella soli]
MPRVFVPAEFEHDPSAYVWTKYAPEIGAAAAGYSRAVYERSLLSLREMEAARIRTADINGCKLCKGMRAARDLPGHLERSGGDPSIAVTARSTQPAPGEDFYEAIYNGDPDGRLSEREKLIVEYADRFGNAPQSMDGDEDFWARMHAAFSDAEIVDATFSIGSWVALGRLTHILDLDGVCMPTFANAN